MDCEHEPQRGTRGLPASGPNGRHSVTLGGLARGIKRGPTGAFIRNGQSSALRAGGIRHRGLPIEIPSPRRPDSRLPPDGH